MRYYYNLPTSIFYTSYRRYILTRENEVGPSPLIFVIYDRNRVVVRENFAAYEDCKFDFLSTEFLQQLLEFIL